jgi:hypothetical protein
VTAPREAGGAGPDIWLDMSRYPDTDPDTALTGAEQDLLSSSLAVDDAELPDAVWEHMLAVVTGADEGTEDPDGTEPDGSDGTDGTDAWAGDWAADPAVTDHTDPTDPALDASAGHVDGDDGVDGGAWDGGAV